MFFTALFFILEISSIQFDGTLYARKSNKVFGLFAQKHIIHIVQHMCVFSQ